MIVEAIIEIPMGTKNKYEIDPVTNRVKLDRVLYSSVTYPAEYGFINATLGGDKDPLDILVLASSPTFPGCVVDARVLGYLELLDQGLKDEKVIAVVDKDPRFDHFQKFEDIPPHMLDEIKDFFKTYKNLQNIAVEVGEFHGLTKTLKLIEECKARKKEMEN